MLMVNTSFINFYSRTFLELYDKIQGVYFLRHLHNVTNVTYLHSHAKKQLPINPKTKG